ncbi:hypothetical protein L2E82_38427 [Cichorium intybus]|uniref:Uncharacterized protein n=1 Tax=Cichorium intybus TaxID=13427 RepID=A0ACB9AFG6_CICIN|nr:hypothetical protein L2E82_38427 [Cichorium intybus]
MVARNMKSNSYCRGVPDLNGHQQAAIECKRSKGDGINSIELGHSFFKRKVVKSWGYETEAFAIYDVMRYVKPPIFTLCVGNAWGEAALLLAASAKGNRSALPSSTIMIKQAIARFQGQASDVEIMRREIKNVNTELVKTEEIEEDIRRPKYFSPSEAVEYGIIDKVIYNERGSEDRGVLSDLRKAQLLIF